MSIDTTKNFIEKSGCGKFIGVLLAAVMFVGVFQSCSANRNSGIQAPAEAKAETPVITAGSFGIGQAAIEELYQRAKTARETQISQSIPNPADFEGLSQSDQTILYASVVGQVVTALINSSYAKEAGVDVPKDAVFAQLTKQFDDQIKAARDQMTKQGALKAGATDAEFDAVIKAQTQKTIAELRAENLKQNEELYATAGGKAILDGTVALELYRESVASKLSIPEQDLKDLSKTVRLLSVVFKSEPGGPDRTAEAEKVLAEVKSGKLSFEAAMDKYSNNPFAPKGKKQSEYQDVLSVQFLMVDKNYGPLRSLKPGELSGVIKGADGPTFFKMIGEEGKTPDDFVSRKAELLANHKKFVANNIYVDKLNADAVKLPVFTDKGYEILYRANLLMNDPKQLGIEKESLEMARAATSGSERPLAAGRFLLERRLYFKLKPDQRKGKEGPYIEATRKFVNLFDGPIVRLDLVEVLAGVKDASAGAELVTAAQTNSSLGDMGQALHTKIFTQLDALKKAKLISDAEAKAVEEIQKAWLEKKKVHDKAKADAAAEQKKQMEAAQQAAKKAEAEAKAKAPAGAPKKPEGPSSSDLMGVPEKK